MDWLKRLGGFLGGVGNQAQRTIGGIGGGANQAFQQAQRAFRPVAQQVQRNIPRPPVIPKIQVPVIPKIQLPPIPQFRPPTVPQFRPPALPQAPKIDFNAVNQALSNYYGRTALSKTPENLQNIGRVVSPVVRSFSGATGEGLNTLRSAPAAANVLTAAQIQILGKAIGNKSIENKANLARQKAFAEYARQSQTGINPVGSAQQIAIDKGGLSGLGAFTKAFGTKGLKAGLEIAPVVTAAPAGISALNTLGRAGTVGAGGNVAYSLLSGSYKNKSAKDLALQAAADIGMGYGGELAGIGLNKVIGKAGSALLAQKGLTPQLPSMYGKAAIGQDVPASYLKPKAPQPGGAPLGQKGLTPQLPKIDVTSPEALSLKPKNVAISKLKSIAGDRELALQDYNAGRYSMTDLPVLVKIEKNGSLTVLDGNGRIIAAQQAGQTNIPITTNEKLYREILDAREKLPSMYGKGTIGQDVPASFLQPKAPQVGKVDPLIAEARGYNKWTDFVNKKVGKTSIFDPKRTEMRKIWENANADKIAKEVAARDSIRAAKEANRPAPNPEKWVADKPIRMPAQVFRGIGKEGGTGMSMYGSGLYTAAAKREAAKYGKVSKLSADSLPRNPLQFKTELDFKAWEGEIARKLGVNKRDMYGVNKGVESIVQPMGYDGITIGRGVDMIAVKYAPTPQAGKTDLPSMYGKGSIGQDVPESFLQPKEPKIPTDKTRGFTKSVQTSPEVSPEFAKLASGTYEGVTKKQTLANTQKLFEGKDINAVQTDIMTRVNSKKAPDAQTISDTIALMKNYDAAGNHEAANAIQQQIAEKLTQSGQTVWAASLLHNRTPEGVLYGARRALNTAGVDITPELEKSLQGAIGKIRTTKGADKDMAIKEMQRLVAQQIPSSFGEKAVALWKAGLLTGIKTQTGNATSNISSIALKKLSDPLAATIDATLGLVTGERTKTATLRSLFSGGKEGFKKAGTFMKTGIDERTGMTNKFDLKLVNYGKSLTGRAAQGYTDFVFKLMGAADRPYYYATLRNNLNDIAIAQAKNGGFKGAERATFIKKFVDTPPEYALQTAIDAAEKSIFANDTLLSGLASGLKTKAGKFEPVVDAIMPFTKVPSAVITRVFDYTPAGAVKTVAKQIASGKLNQRALSEGLAEAGTGTAAIWMGYQLSQAGLMTGPYPKDPKEQDLWVLEGKQPYSIKVGDKWLSMNYTSPIGQVLAIGDDMSIAQKNGESFGGQVAAGALGGAKAVVSQSFLQGTNALLDALNDPQKFGEKYIKQQAASIIPTLANDIAKATDPSQREANNAYEAVIARIPFLSKTLNPKRDVFGNPVQQKSPDALDTLINPFRPSQIPTPTDLGNELRRLQDEKLGTLPDISGKDFFGKNTTVDKSQINKIQSELGPQIQTAWSKAIKDPRYSKLTDDEKKRALDKIKSDITAAYKAGNAQNYGQTWTGTLTKDQGAIYGGQEAGLSVPGQPKIKISKPKKVSKGRKGRAPAKGRAAAKGRATSFKMPKFKKVSARKAPASPKAPKVGKVKGFAKLRPTKSARKTIKIKTG